MVLAMHIIIIGAGIIGERLIYLLTKRSHNVGIIEKSEKEAKKNIIVFSIIRDGELILPNKDNVFIEGDRIVKFGKINKIEEILQLFTKK